MARKLVARDGVSRLSGARMELLGLPHIESPSALTKLGTTVHSGESECQRRHCRKSVRSETDTTAPALCLPHIGGQTLQAEIRLVDDQLTRPEVAPGLQQDTVSYSLWYNNSNSQWSIHIGFRAPERIVS
jgi:hypothetical protein